MDHCYFGSIYTALYMYINLVFILKHFRVAYLDIFKALETFNNLLRMDKLEHNGIEGTTLNWLKMLSSQQKTVC